MGKLYHGDNVFKQMGLVVRFCQLLFPMSIIHFQSQLLRQHEREVLEVLRKCKFEHLQFYDKCICQKRSVHDQKHQKSS